MERRKSEILVTVLDMKRFSDDVLSYLTATGYAVKGCEIEPYYAPLGIVSGFDGKHYLINKEACGDSLSIEEDDAHIRWYRKYLDESGNITGFDMFPFVETNHNWAEISGYASKEIVSLDEFVRVSGGDRLERNFGNWDRFLRGEIDAEGNRVLKA